MTTQKYVWTVVEEAISKRLMFDIEANGFRNVNVSLAVLASDLADHFATYRAFDRAKFMSACGFDSNTAGRQ